MKKIFLLLIFACFFDQGMAQPGPTSAMRPYSIHKSFGLNDPRAPEYLKGSSGIQSIDLSPQGREQMIAQDPTQMLVPPPINPLIPSLAAPSNSIPPNLVPQPILTPPELNSTVPILTPTPPELTPANPILTPTPSGLAPTNPVLTPVPQPVQKITPSTQPITPVSIESAPPVSVNTPAKEPSPAIPVIPEDFSQAKNQTNGTTNQMCEEFGRILEGEVKYNKGVCVVEKHRHLEELKVGGKLTNSFLVNGASFSFEGFDQNGVALNLGEVVLLADEVDTFKRALNKQSGMVLLSLQSQWAETTPPILFRLQWYYLGHPIDFAQRVAAAWKSLKR